MAGVSDDAPRVALLTPCYGPVSMGWHYTVTGAVRDRTRVNLLREVQCNSSVLTKAFNECLAKALDMRDEGIITHVAMAHSDVLAEAGWLNVLWAEMWTTRADLVSAVIPIKGPTGRTSTAVGERGDRWRVRRCLYLKDRERLPPTFGPASVCAPDEVLLVNTGLFLADLRRPWWDDFAFSFHDRIKKTPAGRVAENRSEDWEMSHTLNDAGAKYYATWKVRLRHEGNARYPNYEEV